MKNRKFSRILSVVLCLAMIFTVAVQGISVVSADSVVDFSGENLLVNPGFEDADITNAPGGGVEPLGYWERWPYDIVRTETEKVNGTYGVQLRKTEDYPSLNQSVDKSALVVGMTYRFSIWAKLSANVSTYPTIGVKNFGGVVTADITSTDWAEYSVEFTYSDPSQNPMVYVYSTNDEGVIIYVDDASLTVVSDISKAEIENGKITVTMNTENVDPNAFTAFYTSNVESTPQSLALTGSVDGNVVELTYTPIRAAAVDQNITVSLTYNGLTVTLTYTVKASDDIPIVAGMLKDIKVDNGSIKIYLNDAPTIAPQQNDFTFGLNVDGEDKNFTVTNFNYNANEKTVDVSFSAVSSIPNAQRNVIVTVDYNGLRATSSYNVEQSSSHTYYVSSADGDDSNNGLSEETPFASIDKLNSLVFVPGDKILFKSGDTFTGTLKPQGSGSDGAPIIIASYGEGEKPVLRPGDPWQIRRIGSGEASDDNAMIGGGIYLYNVEYYEIRDLELEGDSYNDDHKVCDITVYNAGIRVHNINMGDLHHYVFDNLVIHGFRGPGTNLGKSAGAISLNVDIDPDNSAANVKSSLNDISITNCEMYEVGRCAVNSLNVWSNRRYADDPEAMWTYNTNGSLPWYPDTNLYVGNNYFHEIDGDAVIVDGFDGAVVEHNLCYRTAVHLSTGARNGMSNFGRPMAVALFNWNSDNTVFQYNETYAIGLNGTRHNASTGEVMQGVTAQDGHGIEIDALNDGTWVQYNYSHDNAAFMMLCCESNTYRSYNSVIRYNISVNDGYNTEYNMGYFFNGNFAFNTEVYNNVMYMNETVIRNGQAYLFNKGGVQDVYKFYNNIFYYSGETPVAGNWNDNCSDFQSNIIYGFTNAPIDDNPEHPNIIATESPFVNGGTVNIGTAPGVMGDVSGYNIKAGSVAIDKGVIPSTFNDGVNSGVDFAGHVVTGTPDIGAFEYGEYPDAPVNVTVSDITSNSAVISWTAPEGDVSGYVLKDTNIMDKNGKLGSTNSVIAELDDDTLSYTMEGLFPGTRYSVSVYSTDGDTQSAQARVVFTTPYVSGADNAGSYILGDVNADGNITSLDATLVLQHAAGILDLGKDTKTAAYSVTENCIITAAPAPIAAENGLIFREENIEISDDAGYDLTNEQYAQEVMDMSEGTFVFSFISTSTSTVQSLISVANANTGDVHFHIYVNPVTGVIGMEARNGSNISFATAAGNLNPVGEENTVAVRYTKDTQTYSVFANGKKVADFADKARFIDGINGRNAVTLGKTTRSSGNSYPFGGTIAYAEAYSTLLADDDLIAATAPKTRTPSNLKGVATGTDVTLSWEAPAGITDIVGYVIKLGDTVIAEVSDTSCTIIGFAPNTEFTFSVASKTIAGVLSDSVSTTVKTGTGQSTADPVAPSAATGVTASAITAERATITWAAPEDTSNVGGYVIKSGDTVLAVTGASTTSYTLSGLTPGTKYTITVYARYWNDDSVLSEGADVQFETSAEGSGIASRFAAADVNKDGSVTSLDATLILQYAAGIIKEF